MSNMLGDAQEHARLVKRMQRVTNTSLDGDQRDRLNATDENLIHQCRQCGHVRACKNWLEHMELGEERAAQAPVFCANASVFSDITAK